MRQQRTPDELRSRVFAAGEAIVVVAMSASIAVGGPLIQAAGPRAAYALTGVLGLLAAVTIWWGAWELHTQQSDTAEADAEARRDVGGHAPGRRARGRRPVRAGVIQRMGPAAVKPSRAVTVSRSRSSLG